MPVTSRSTFSATLALALALVLPASSSAVRAQSPTQQRQQNRPHVTHGMAGADSTARNNAGADSLPRPHDLSPYASYIIAPDSVDLAPITSMSDMLQARVPGLSVQRISGASGSASRLRLRGIRSPAFSSAPLVIVDGVRMEVAAPHWLVSPSSNFRLGTEWWSRLDVLDPEDIERVEILGGPAAAARFGRGAANGAILVSTKQGSPDGPHWAAHGTFGTVNQATDFPASFDQRGIDNSGMHIDRCGVILQARYACAPIADSLLSSNALESHSPFRTGTRSQLGINGSGGNDHASIYLAGNFTREDGTLDINALRRNHILANGRLRLFRSLEIGARAGYGRGSLSGIAPSSDPSILRSGLAGGPENFQGYLTPPESIAQSATQRSIARLIMGTSATWQPIRWLRIVGTIGVGRDDWIEDQSYPAAQSGFSSAHRRTKFGSDASTARAEASASWRIGSALRLGSSLGIERLRHTEKGRSRLALDENLGSNLSSVDAFESRGRLNSRFGLVELAWKDRISVAGGLRHDRVWHGDDAATYPSIALAWQISDEPWFPRDGAVSMLRLRTAFGEAGPGWTNLAILQSHGASESEGGVDAELFGGRATLAFTYYRGKSDASPYAISSPLFPPQFAPALSQSVRNSGVEAAISTTIVDGDALSIHLDATAAFPRARFEGLTIYLGSAEFGPQRLVTGYPVAGYWAPPILGYNDMNGDGLIGDEGCTVREFPSAPTCEVKLGEAAYIGSSIPTRELSLRPRVTRHRVTLSALFDYRGGHKLFNRTAYARCRLYRTCRAIQDRQAPLADQASVVAATLGSPTGYIEDASYLKFRELSLGLAAPEHWAARVGAKRLTLTLAVRNLATWTSYGGPDPEVSSDGYDSLLAIDVFSQPAGRYLIMRLDLGW